MMDKLETENDKLSIENYILRRKLASLQSLIPGNKDNVMVAAFPKCGTHFLGSVVAEILGTKLKMLTMFPPERPYDHKMFEQAPIGGHFNHLSKNNMEFMRDNGWKVVVGIRDPRDQLISHYHYYTGANRSHHDGPFLCSLHPKDALCRLITGYSTDEHLRPPMSLKYRDWFRQFKKAEDMGVHVKVVKYEELLTAPKTTVREIAEFLDRDCDVEKVIEETSFDKPHPNVPIKVKRRGLMGEWKDHFTEDVEQLFVSMGGNLLMEELGYA
jgi:hypothetical protein